MHSNQEFTVQVKCLLVNHFLIFLKSSTLFYVASSNDNFLQFIYSSFVGMWVDFCLYFIQSFASHYSICKKFKKIRIKYK